MKVGLAAGFSGPVAVYGQKEQLGIELAFDELKTSHPNWQFTLVTADDQCSPAGGASAYAKLVDQDQVDVILGSPCSGATLGGMPALKAGGVPGITYSATNPAVTDQAGVGGNTYEWRINLNETIMGNIWANYIATSGVTKLAMLAQNTDGGRGSVDAYKKIFANTPQVKVVDVEYFDVGTSDVRPQLTKAEQAGANGVVINAEVAECALIARQMHELSISFNPYFFSSAAGCNNPQAMTAMGDPTFGNGLLEGGLWQSSPDQPMIAAYKAKNGEEPPADAAMAYYAAMTLGKALEAGGAGRAGIEKGLSLVDWQSPIGPIKFDDHNQAHTNFYISKNENGTIVLLKTLPTTP